MNLISNKIRRKEFFLLYGIIRTRREKEKPKQHIK